jgi:hypothetical protein
MSTKRTLKRGTAYDVRVIALAKHLGLDPPEQLSATQWIRLWALIGMELAEKYEPEFGWGPGRRPGSPNKQLAHTSSKDVLRKREQRLRKRLTG